MRRTPRTSVGSVRLQHARHLLTSKHHVYGVRTPGGRYAKLECSPTTAGKWVRRASPSGMPTRGWGRGLRLASVAKTPAVLDRGSHRRLVSSYLRRILNIPCRTLGIRLQRGGRSPFHLVGIRNLALALHFTQ